jgi:periplasmic protein TonB
MENQKQNLDDIVFENRNKDYGAYYLRKNYKNYLTRAVVIGTSFIFLIFGGAFTYQTYILPNLPKEKLKIVELDLKDISKIEEPEEIKIIPPPPKVETPPMELEQVKFLPPEPKTDDQVSIEEPPPSIEKIEKAIISNKNVEGEEAKDVFVLPPPPVETKIIALEKSEEEEKFTSVEQMPEYPGGNTEMYKFLYSLIKYPAAAQRGGIGGKVFLKFLVEKDGSITNVEVLRGIGFGCDDEAVKAVKSMPKWNPGRQNGKNVRVYFQIPITFKME